MKGKEIKKMHREGAEARKAERDAISHSDQLKKLDARFGVGQGAKRERARLNHLIGLGQILGENSQTKADKAMEAVAQKARKDKARKHNLEIAENNIHKMIPEGPH